MLVVVTTWTATDVAALRDALRLTNEGLADHLGVSPRSVRSWLAGGAISADSGASSTPRSAGPPTKLGFASCS